MSVANNLTGKTLSNRYEILRPLGEGGMGKVYLAKDGRFGKQVVVKVPTMEAGDKDFKDRFMREIASLATLEHPHIVTTVDWGEIEGIPFLVLRYLSGGSLRDRITDAQGYYKPMPLEGLNQWLPQIASALDFIHTKNWVHRDLKPDNILFDEAGNPYLADFGIAKALEGAPMGVKTTMGAFIGTPQYMAPEMHLGKGIGPRADQFGLAVLVYEALAGKIPFAGATPTAIFVEVMQGKARPIHELVPGIPLEKSNALMKGITKEPRDRYGSCVEFANAITGSMLARGASSAGSETPSRVVIPRTRMETPKKADIPGTRIETPSKPEILGIKNETPSIPLIAGTRLETPSQPEITGTKLETPSNKGSKQNLKLRQDDYLTKEGQLLAQVCRDLVEAGKVTKELFLEARKFCKSNDVTGMLGGVLLAEKIETIVKTGHVSKEISQEILSLACEILGLEKPAIAGTRMETPSEPEIVGTRTERDGVKVPVVEEALPNNKGMASKLIKAFKGFPFFFSCLLIVGVLLVTITTIGTKVSSTFTSSATGITDANDGIASIEKEMVLIPPGKFKMGSPTSEKGRSDDEKQREITLTNPYYIGKHEVTQEQWESVMGNNPSSSTKGPKLPVTDVSWEDCQEFIKKLNGKTNGAYRLPTEAEWEYACRAGTTTVYSFGDSLTKSDANVGDSLTKMGNINGSSTKAVGSYRPNVFGLYDMHGNVWEWCEDWYGSLQDGEVTDPKGPATGTSRVLRGGSFLYDVEEARSSNRLYITRSFRNDVDLGFRLVRTINSDDLSKPDIKAFLLKSKQEEEAKAKQMELVKLKQEEATAKQMELVMLALGKEMVLIPAGKFKMGSPASEKGRNERETHHEVTLSKPYYMGKYEVTQELWEAVMGNNPSSKKGAKLPVTDVSWEDCQEFIKKLNARTNGDYRLPTEAEWEYACRADTITAYAVGDSLKDSDANFRAAGTAGDIKAVGGYKPNAFGLYDMHGNVLEWCEDWYAYAAYPEESVTDPKGPAAGTSRVFRGGSFYDDVSRARSSFRASSMPTNSNYCLGFRMARTADLKTEITPTAPKQDPAAVMPATGSLLVASFTEAKAKEVQKSLAKSLQKEVEEKEDLGQGIKLELVLIPTGKFIMGSPASEKGRSSDETQHEVTLTKPFYIGKHEVTQEQWESVMKNNPSSRTKGAKLPVTDVSWEDCQEFIKKLNSSTKSGYRLPYEAEFEYACRAGTTTAYSFGDRLTISDANILGDRIKAVGSYKPNAFGLYDMHGNVWEWCEDWYAAYPAGAVADPKGPLTREKRVLRGGSFNNDVSSARSSNRVLNSPTARVNINGLRLARTADLKTEVTPTVPKPDPTTLNLLEAPFTEAKAKEVQKEVAKSLKKEVEEKVDLGKGIKLEMVLIPAGKFMMGSPVSEVGRLDNETQHEVTLTRPFYMGKYEVTQEQWETIMGNNPSKNKGAKLPVTNVSWDYCQEFIKKLNAKTDGGYRLPTEAEWEYACRAGTTTYYSFGDSLTKSDANANGDSIMPVGSYKSNALGLYDMHGNVWEWCNDCYSVLQNGAAIDPKGAATGTNHVTRGGSFIYYLSMARSSLRLYGSWDLQALNGGFRLARTADIKASVAVPKPNPAEVIPSVGNLLVAPFNEAKAKEVQKSLAKSLQKEVDEKEDLGQGVKLDLVLIPAGKFMMGSPELEKDRLKSETQHEVTFTKPYYFGKYEITQEQWQNVMGENPSKNKGSKLPVTNVSWEDCQEFIKKLNAKTKGDYRLPTEAEWEFASRAGTTTAYSVGDSLTKADANISGDSIKSVGSYKPNAFGIYGMHGNAWEWCEDWKADYPAGAITDPKGPATGTGRVLRGGSFNNSESPARSSYRYAGTPTARSQLSDVGFRLARAANIKAAVAASKPNPTEAISAGRNLLIAPFSEAKAKELQKSEAKSLQKEVEENADLGKGVNLEMVLVPTGKFMMGSPASENGRDSNETQHEVTLTKLYYIGKYEVTQEQWETIMGNNPSENKGAKLPVTNISWLDCQEYIKKLNTKTNGGYRLPTEAEWEYACRAGTATSSSYGNSFTTSDANYGTGVAGSIKAVGSYKANAFGLFNMHGNVWEWCEDWYGSYPEESVTDPMGPPTGERRVLRGGSFGSDRSSARSSFRGNYLPANRSVISGFRLARDP